MFCRKCGNTIDDDSKFCAHCGESVVNEKSTDSIIFEPSDAKNDKNTTVSNQSTALKVIEILLWIGLGLILLNLIYGEIDWWGVISASAMVLTAIAYIKDWFKNFEIPLVLMIIGLFVNISVFSIIDVLLYGSGIIGVILKKKNLDIAS